jgi:hypothetical protein
LIPSSKNSATFSANAGLSMSSASSVLMSAGARVEIVAPDHDVPAIDDHRLGVQPGA